GAEIFGPGGRLNKALSVVFQPRCIVDEQPSACPRCYDAGYGNLYTSKLTDEAATGQSFSSIIDGIVDGALSQAHHLSADSDSSFVQGLNSYLVPFSHLTQYILFRDETVVEEELASR